MTVTLIKSIIKGAARVMDLGNTLSNKYIPMNDEEVFKLDAASIQSDWHTVGDDLRLSIKKYQQST
jgi:hypothetical protein